MVKLAKQKYILAGSEPNNIISNDQTTQKLTRYFHHENMNTFWKEGSFGSIHSEIKVPLETKTKKKKKKWKWQTRLDFVSSVHEQ